MTSDAHLLETAIRGFRIPRSMHRAAFAPVLLAVSLLALSPASAPVRSTGPSAAIAKLSALPLAARSLVSRTLGQDQASYAAHRSGTGLIADNDGQGLSARFEPHGVQVRAGGDTLGLRLSAAGRGRSLYPVAPATPTEHANRVSYRRGSLTEWYANGPLGLEQGFTLKAPPAHAMTGQLTLALSLSGGLTPSLERGARSLSFAGSGLRYTGLTVFDARGRRLPAHLELSARQLLIRADDRDARYPLTVDPFVQLAKLTASDSGAAGDLLGTAIAISGDTVAVAAPWVSVAGHTQQGAAYVFVKPPGGWANGTETAKLTASDGGQTEFFGDSIAIDGDTIVVGETHAYVGGHQQGAAYVFVKPASGWASGTETAKLTASDGRDGDRFGTSVAISGDTVVAGAQWADVAGHADQGAAYIFLKPAGGWTSGTETAKLTSSDGAAYDYFGTSAAISGDAIVIGADFARVSGIAAQGAAYVFVKPAGGWTSGTETAKLTASDPAYHNIFAASVAISGDVIVIGAPDGYSSQGRTGAAYVFVEPAGGWASAMETAKLTATDAGSGHRVGSSVAIAGDTIVVGDPGYRGAVYVFVKPPGGWASGTETGELTASDAVATALGSSVAIASDTIVAGAPNSTDNAYRGAAYVFGKASTAISVTKQLVPASDPGRFDLKVGGTVVKAAAGNGASGIAGVAPGTYRVAESAAAGTSLSGYSTSIACTLNGKPGPSVNGTNQLDVTVADGDQAACTITNRRKATITMTKHLVPSSDPGRFDLKIGGTVVKAGAGDGDSGATTVGAGAYTVSEVAAVGTSLLGYVSSIACTRNGAPGPSGSGTSLNVTVTWGDVLACTITNQPGGAITLTKHLVPSSDPGRFDLRVGQAVVKAAAGEGGSGSIRVVTGSYRVTESGAGGTSLAAYSTSIACTVNGNPGPSVNGTTQLNVTIAKDDQLACTLTNRRRATIRVVKHLVPSSDPGRFDLKIGGTVVKAGAGDGDSGSSQVGAGTYTVSEVAAAGTSLADYTSSIACTRNGGSGPSGNGASLNMNVSWGDVLVCTITNQRI